MNATRAGMDVHEATRRLVLGLRRLTDDALASLPEPPTEPDNPRLSLYVGWRDMDALATVSGRTQLSISRIVRRLVYGLVVTGAIRLGENGEIQEFRAARVQTRAVELDSESFVWIVLVVLAVTVIGIVLRYQWLRTHRRKRKMDSRKPEPSSTETDMEAAPQ